MSTASEKAIDGALGPAEVAWEEDDGNHGRMVRDVATALHDPALGLERSVCLRHVVATLRLMDPSANGWGRTAAEHIEATFVGSSEGDE